MAPTMARKISVRKLATAKPMNVALQEKPP
jgi:hypothetical protein